MIETSEPAFAPRSGVASRVSIPAWEYWGLAVFLALYGILQTRNIYHFAYIGQDFPFHRFCTEEALEHPSEWFHLDATNRPLIYWIGAGCAIVTRGHYTFETAAIVTSVCSAFGIIAVWLAIMQFITRPIFRLLAVGFLSLLPTYVMTAVVYAADALAALPFIALCWSLQRYLVEPRPARWAAIGCLAYIAGIFSKATFAPLLLGIGVIALIAWARRWISHRRVIGMVAAFILLPTSVTVALQIRSARELAGFPPRHVFIWPTAGEMSWRSLLLPKLSDTRIYRAPTYWDKETKNGIEYQPVVENNGFSYPALFILSAFTDVLNCANPVRLDTGWNAPRPPRQAMFARVSVALGVFTSVLALAASGSCGWRLLRGRGGEAVRADQARLIWLGLGLCWLAPIMFSLPLLKNAYYWGYWLTRLTLPAVITGAVIMFAELDRVFGANSRPRLERFLIGFFFLEGATHFAALLY